ncbi:MAG: hypothetical protein AB7I30_18805, partial [Isosphaeraceae bacterium]
MNASRAGGSNTGRAGFAARRSRIRRGVGVEPLEARTLLTTIPVFQSYDEAGFGGDLPELGGMGATAETAPLLETSPMRLTRVTGDLAAFDRGDVVRIALEAGQIVTARASATRSSATPFALRLADASGTTLASTDGSAAERETLGKDAAPALTFRAPIEGVYLVSLAGIDLAGPVHRSYALEIRPIGLNRDAIGSNARELLGVPNDPATPESFQAGGSGPGLANVGAGITGFLGPTGRLNLVGPTGYGFELTGNWVQVTTPIGGGQSTITFFATAGLGIVTPIGVLGMPLPAGGSIVLTTLPNANAGAFGEIDQTRIFTGLAWLDAITQNMTTHFGSTYVLPDGSGSVDFLNGFDVGLALGSTINSSIDANAPLNPNVPYLYVVFAVGASASFGNFSVSAGVGGGQFKFTAYVDPADPVADGGLSTPAIVPGLSRLGVGASRNGRSPFTP